MKNFFSFVLMSMTGGARISGDFARVIEDNLDLIDRVVAYVARARGLNPDEREELGSRVKLKLVDRDYEVLRAYEGHAGLKSYLVTVAQSVCLDYRNQLWGKWRPSITAKRLGPIAEKLEQAISRDGLSQSDAVTKLHHDPHVEASEAHLFSLCEKLPIRHPRRFLGEGEIEQMPAPDPCGEQELMNLQRGEALHNLETSLGEALAKNTVEDQLIVKMAYFERLKISQIARMLGLDQKKLYRRLDKIIDSLRHNLEAQGYRRQMVIELLGD